jgi:hypothetical protein
MKPCRSRVASFALLLLLVAGAHAQLDWGTDRQLHASVISQFGIAADCTRGPDTAFVGLIASGQSGDTVEVLRTTDDGEHWESVWETTQLNHAYSNLALRVCAGQGGWIIVMWLDRDSSNNGDVAGARVLFDGSEAFPLQPVAPSRDTLTGLAMTRSFDSVPIIYVVWQDELGRGRAERAPRILIARSSDLGQTWTAPQTLLDSFEMPAIDHGAPGHIYVAARSVPTQDIEVTFSTDQGQHWARTWLTDDTTDGNDMFPAVAATHDSATGERAWVSYDHYGASGWDVNYAYTVNAGGLWVLDRTLANGTDDQFLSNLDCTSSGSRRVRAVYLSQGRDSGFHVYYCSAQAAHPTNWSSPIVISDTQASDAMTPVVTSYGVAGDTLDKGLIFYAGIGPRDLWYDAQQFTGLRESRMTPAPAVSLQAASLIRDELVLRLFLAGREKLELDLYTIDGRLKRTLAAGECPAGDVQLRIPVPDLAAGSYLLRLRAGHETSVCKVVCVR